METNVFKTVISMKVTSITTDDIGVHRCNVTVKMHDQDVQLKNVLMSSLLKWKFDNREEVELNKVYECTIAEQDWTKMPFQLLIYNGKEDGRRSYMLQCVEVAKSKKVESKGLFGDTVVDYQNRYHKAVNYRRLRNNYNRALDKTIDKK